MQNHYLSEDDLASYYVQAPDPMLACPPLGQRLYITWSLPENYMCYKDLYLAGVIRFGNKEEDRWTKLIRNSSGSFMYYLVGDAYFEKKGIQTFVIEVIGDGQVLEEWRHQLWVELITFNEDKQEDEQCDNDNESEGDGEDEDEDEKDENNDNSLKEEEGKQG